MSEEKKSEFVESEKTVPVEADKTLTLDEATKDAEKKMAKGDKKCCGKCNRVRKIVRRTLLGLAIFFGILLLTISIIVNQLDPIVKTAVEAYGPKMLGVPVTLGEVNFSILRMRFELKELVVGNPEGFKTANAISVGRIYLGVKPSSLLRKTIYIEQILVEDPQITYEVGLGDSNIGTILNNLNKDSDGKKSKDEEKKDAPKPASKEGGKKVVIGEARVSGGMIKLSAKIMQGVAAPVPLPTVALHDIGADKEGGTSMVDATGEILKKTLTSVTDVSKQALNKIGDAAKAAAGAVSDGVKSGINAVKGLFGGKKEEEK